MLVVFHLFFVKKWAQNKYLFFKNFVSLIIFIA